MTAKPIRQARERRDYTQAQLAHLAGINVTQLAHYETGSREPSVKNLRLLAVALDVSADYLLGLISIPRRIQP